MFRSTPHPAQAARRPGPTTPASGPRARMLAIVAAALSALIFGGLPSPAVAAPALAETLPSQPATVSADPLPTVQINGVAWAQVLVGNTVYVAGEFTSARPAGAAAGVNETPRGNLLAYDLTTGELVTSWAPTLDGPAYSIAASPDGTRIYVGGLFNNANATSRRNFAVLDARTGALNTQIRPAPNAAVRAIVATAGTIYIGGNFTQIGTISRTRVAALTATSGGVTSFVANVQAAQVDALLLTPDGKRLVLGGRFRTINGIANRGSGWVDATTGASLPFPANQKVQNYGGGYSAGISSLTLAGDLIIGTGWGRLDTGDGSSANLEGMFAADWRTGQLVWVQDCHGDTYSTFGSSDGHVYLAGHPHSCVNAAGFPEVTPRVHRYGLAFTDDARHATVRNATTPYANWGGTPSPELANWFPDFSAGTFTGQRQAGWSVVGNADFVAYGGEFPRVNGKAQAGLVRFAKRSLAPNAVGPVIDRPGLTATRIGSGAVALSWAVASDKDDPILGYRVTRNGTTVATLQHDSRFWDRTRLSTVDTAAPTSGAALSYSVVVTDSAGRSATYGPVSVAPPTGAALATYPRTVLEDAPSNYWRLGDTGTTLQNLTGFQSGSATGVTTGVAGGVLGGDTAMQFAGTPTSSAASSPAATPAAEAATNSMSVEAWFRTTTTTGGKIVGFGSARTGTSPVVDRHVFMSDTGRVSFGIHPNEQKVLTSPMAYNDGAWHHVVATLGADGAALYVDGAAVASAPDVVAARQPVTGYWRIGGDDLTGWTPAAGSGWFAGTIDEVATYNHPLAPEDVARHHSLGTTGEAPKIAPVAALTTSVDRLTVSADATTSKDADGRIASYAWTFGDGTSATGPTAQHTYAAAGTYRVTLTVTDDAGLTGTTTKDVVVATGAPVPAFTAAVDALAVSVDASTSTDPDGTLASYAWTFGDGSTATGVRASHTYAAAGTYPVALTVTDDDGQTATVRKDVAVTAPSAVAGRDAFGRTVASGWGSADLGGLWTTTAGVASVAGGVGVMNLAQSSSAAGARLPGVAGTDLVTEVSTSFDKVPNGSGAFQLVRGRIATNGDEYRLKLQYTSAGRVTAWFATSVAGRETTISPVVTVPLTFTAGSVVQTRFAVDGTSPTQLQAKVWLRGTPEPAQWTLAVSDTTPSLQAAGHTGLYAQLSSTTTNGPVAFRVDDLVIGRLGAGTPATPPPPPPNAAPTASFTAAVSGQTVSVNGAASSDTDGTVASYAWEFGDGSRGTGAQASRTYAAAGTYTVRLTVTDDDGATATATRSVTVTAPAPAPNAAPTASFTAAVSGQTVSVDAAASSDTDGSVASYAWDFGDASTGTGVQASRTYTAAGTYTVRLTVTDDRGATGTTTRSVTVTAPPAPPTDPQPGEARVVAQDAFERQVTSGFGSAEAGGAWTTTAGVTSVSGGAGVLTLARANSAASGRLPSATGTDLVTQVATSLDKIPNGSGAYQLVRGRITTGDDAYRLKLQYLSSGAVRAWWTRTVGGVESTVGSTVNAPVTYRANEVVLTKVAVTGTNPTRLRAKVWKQGTAEPAAWLLDVTDGSPTLQAPGHVGVYGQLSSTTTNGPLLMRFHDFLTTEGPIG